MIERESARLRKVFKRILIASAAGSGALSAYACSSSSSTHGFGGQDAATMGDSTSGGDSAQGGNDSATGDHAMAQEDSSGGEAGCSQDAGPDALFSGCCEPSPPVYFDAGADVPQTCVQRITLPCGLPSFVTSIYPPTCFLALGECAKICTGTAAGFLNCEVSNGFGCNDDAMAFVAADGEAIKIDCNFCNGVGRRPTGLARARKRRAASVLGSYFASAAHLEAASVHAFERLAVELEAHGAPASLVRAARRSACDEVRHARVTSRLARRFGGEPASVRVRAPRARSLAAVALENAIEGCVRETFGALVATWQAEHAQDEGIRRSMKRIARDETRHAALSWAVARALEPMLDERGRRRVATARARAVEKLRREATAASAPELVREAGVPDACQSHRMLDELANAMWS
jgi:rubrerythrin